MYENLHDNIDIFCLRTALKSEKHYDRLWYTMTHYDTYTVMAIQKLTVFLSGLEYFYNNKVCLHWNIVKTSPSGLIQRAAAGLIHEKPKLAMIESVRKHNASALFGAS